MTSRKVLLIGSGIVTAALIAGTATMAVAQRDGHGWRGGDHGHGGWHRSGRGQRQARVFERYDTDKNGEITQSEVDAVRQAQLDKFDADKNGTLTLEEFQALWMEQHRQRMVRAFQRQDRDGNAELTAEEFNRRASKIVERMDRNGDGKLSKEDRRSRNKARRNEKPERDEMQEPDNAPDNG